MECLLDCSAYIKSIVVLETESCGDNHSDSFAHKKDVAKTPLLTGLLGKATQEV